MTKNGNYHVTPHDDGWAVQKEGGKRASRVADTQRDAIDIARELSVNQGGGEVSVHGRNNRIRDKFTAPGGNDLFPPKG